MTTDVATLPEQTTGAPDAENITPTTEPEGAVSTPDGAASTGEETQSTSETESESPVFDSAEAYLESLEKQDGKTEERQQRPAVNPELARAARDRFQATHRENLAYVDELRALILEGADSVTIGEKLAEGKERLNKFFQSAVNDAGYEAAQQANAATISAIWEGLEKALPKGSVEKLTEAITKGQEAGTPLGWADVASFVKDTAVSEFKQSTEYKSGLKEAFNAGRAAGERSREVAQSGKTPGGIGSSGPSSSDNEKLADPNTPIAEVQAILARQAAG